MTQISFDVSADLNGDGLIDVYLVNSPSYSAKDFVFISQGNGSYIKMNGIDSFICGTHIECASVGVLSYHIQDLNYDNIADILTILPPLHFTSFSALHRTL